MRILYVTTISNTVNAFLVPHIRMLINYGHQVDVAFNLVQEVHPELVRLGCKVHNVKFQRSVFKRENIAAYKEIKKIVREEKYDLVHTHTPIASFLTRLACKNIPGLKIFYTAHGFHFFQGSPLKNWLLYYSAEKISANWTDVLVTMNEEDYKNAKRIMNKKGEVYKVNGVGIDLNKFYPQTKESKNKLRMEYGYTSDDFILIYVGELSYRKNQESLIKSVNQLVQKIPNLKVLLVGDGPLKESYKNLVINLGVQNHIEFLGYRKDVDKLMLLSDIAVSTSRQEGLPVNVMEAMATGLPLVASNCRGNIDLVKEEKNGIIVDINDINSLSTAIYKLYESRLIREKFSTESLKMIKNFEVNRVVSDMEKIYKRWGI